MSFTYMINKTTGTGICFFDLLVVLPDGCGSFVVTNAVDVIVVLP